MTQTTAATKVQIQTTDRLDDPYILNEFYHEPHGFFVTEDGVDYDPIPIQGLAEYIVMHPDLKMIQFHEEMIARTEREWEETDAIEGKVSIFVEHVVSIEEMEARVEVEA